MSSDLAKKTTKKTYAPGCPSSCGSASCTSYRFFSAFKHLVTIANIQVFSSWSAFPAGLPEGWNATLRPSCKGICFINASFRDLESRGYPVDPRGGTVIDTPRVPAAGDGTAAVPPGDGARGRCLRFSTTVGYWVSTTTTRVRLEVHYLWTRAQALFSGRSERRFVQWLLLLLYKNQQMLDS